MVPKGRQAKLLALSLLLTVLVLITVSCNTEATSTATQAVLVPKPTANPTPTLNIQDTIAKAVRATIQPAATLAPKPVPTSTPTTATAAEIFSRVSPSVAFIQTSRGSGSGVLVEGGYIVTNAHVVWPFEEVRVVFPDGSEHLNAPVLNSDLLGDLAVIGPLQTTIAPVALADGEALAIGSDVYLIGYPAEIEQLPQPTITRGILSRLRTWEAMEMTYFQTDAAIGGGQSGGVLVSSDGQVIGISGFLFSEARFGIVASAADVLPRVERLIAGEDVSGLGNRRKPLDDGKVVTVGKTVVASMDYLGDLDYFLIDLSAGDTIDITVDSVNFDAFVWVDFPGAKEGEIAFDDDSGGGLFGLNAKLTYRAPYDGRYFIIVDDAEQENVGGYFLTVSEAPPGAIPSPLLPPPARAAAPILASFGVAGNAEEAARRAGFDLPAMLPDLAVLLRGASVDKEGFVHQPDLISSYEREFSARGLISGADIKTMNITTTVALHNTALEAKGPVLELEEQDVGELAELFGQGFTEEDGFKTENIIAEPLVLPPLGDAAAGFLVRVETVLVTFEIYFLSFSQGRIAGQVVGVGPSDQIALEDIIRLAQSMDERIRGNTPSPVFVATPVPTPVVRATDVPKWVSIGADHHYNGIIRFVHRANPGFLDVHYGASSTTTLLPSGPRFNQLLQYDPTNSQEIIGDLAESWEVSKDGLTLTFHIAEFNWQDGVPGSADDVIFSLDRMAQTGVTRGRVTAIRDFYERGSARDPDPRTVIMPLKFPSATALGWLAVDYYKIYPRHVVANKTQDELNCCFENNVGSGPWVFKEWKKGDSWEYERNDDYFKNPIPFYDNQKVFIIRDAARRLASMKTGQVDAWLVMGGTTLADMLQVQKETGGRMRAVASGAGALYGFWLHLNKPPMDDPRVRRAIFLALDRKEIMDIGSKGEGTMGSFFPPGYAHSDEELLQVPGFRLDNTDAVAEAKKLLTEAGFPEGFKVTFNVDQSKTSRTNADLIAAQLLTNLNIEVEIQVADRAKFYQGLRDGSANMSTIGSGFYFLDPQVILVQWFGKDTLRNPHNWENPRMNELMALEANELYPEVRRGYFKEMADILHQGESHYVPLYWFGRAGAVDYRIQNFKPPYHPHTIWKWDQIWWDPDAKIRGPDAPPIR